MKVEFMNEITYRIWTKQDGPAIEALISDSFHLERYVPEPRVLAQLKHTYLQSCLAEQTFARVAVRDGRPVGVIMCNAKGRYRLLPHLPALWATLRHQLRMTAASRRYKCSTESFHQMHRIYHSLTAGRAQRYDGVLTLFAVDQACRGTEIGRELLHQAEAYLTGCGVRRIYLYTDSTCNTAFYDRHGFSRADQRAFSAAVPGSTEEASMSVFLYEKQYREEEPPCGSP